MKQLLLFSLAILIGGILLSPLQANAGFWLHRQQEDCITTNTRTNGGEGTPAIDHSLLRQRIRSVPFTATHGRKKTNGFLACLSAGCGVLGVIVGAPQTVLLMLLLGMTAGITGKIGLKRYKRQIFLRVLCYAGIILGAIVVLFATIPLLFLV